ncbi:MAG: alpha-mannosidase, partial [Pseudomonadota bacterium]
MNHAFRFTAEKIAHRLDLVRDHRFPQMQPLPPFRLNWMRDALAQPDFEGPTDHLPEIAPGTYWAGVDQHFALHSHFTLPEDWHQPALWMPFGSMGDVFNHPEALVWIDGVAVGSADRHHHLISLGQAVKPGPHRLTLAGWTGWAGWPPDPAAQDRLIMRPAFVVERDPALEAFLTLAACTWETATLPGYEAHLREALLDALDRAFVTLDTRDPIGAAFFASAPGALAGLERDLKAAGAPAEQKLLAIGHAHIDIGYLWPVMESRAKNARTYTNVLNLMRQNGDYRFSHSQAQLYAMTEVDQPELFAEIKTRVAEGRWEVLGGMWVEPDTNMPGAEALVRQITIGRHWFAQAFGADAETPVLWLPDTFGFAWCLPQLMAQSGLKMLITSKLNWNQHNPTPWSTFQWQGIDGTRVPVHILTTPRPVDHLPFPTNYKSDLSAAEVHGTLTAVRGAPLPALPICYGYGDGGGGPTKALIARARAFAAMPGMPQMGMGRVSDLVDLVLPLADSLPVIDDELYMEGHRGVLTGQGWIKRANREAEAALHRAELVAVLAGQQQIPEELTQAWQLLCLNQFHDIITGTCIPQVMADARTDMAEIMRLCGLAEARHQPDAGALGILNPSTCARADVAFTEAALPEDVPHQKVAGGALIGLPEMPAYGAVPLNTARIGTGVSAHIEDGVIHLENAHFSCEIGADGTLHSMHDRRNQRTLLAPGT